MKKDRSIARASQEHEHRYHFAPSKDAATPDYLQQGDR